VTILKTSYFVSSRLEQCFSVFSYQINLSSFSLEEQGMTFDHHPMMSSSELVECFKSQRPGCLVVNGDYDLREFLASFSRTFKLLPFVVVTSGRSLDLAVTAAKHGAHSVVCHSHGVHFLKNAIYEACLADVSGDCNPHLLRCRINSLTRKERQVLFLSIRGKTTKSIAGELNVCHQTIDKHKKRALFKLRCSTVVGAVNLINESRNQAANLKVERLAYV
jgi:FixJ family two-component response regulator